MPNTKIILCRLGLERWGLGLIIIHAQTLIKGLHVKDREEEEENFETDDDFQVEEETKKGIYKVIIRID